MNSLILIGLALGAISFTVTFTSIFSFLRDFMEEVHPKLGELFSCPWCLSFWINIPLSLWNVDTEEELSFIVIAFFATWAIAGLFHYFILQAYEPVAKAKMLRERKKNTR